MGSAADAVLYMVCVCVANLLLLLFDQKAAGRKQWTVHAVGKGLSLYLRGLSLYLKGFSLYLTPFGNM